MFHSPTRTFVDITEYSSRTSDCPEWYHHQYSWEDPGGRATLTHTRMHAHTHTLTHTHTHTTHHAKK